MVTVVAVVDKENYDLPENMFSDNPIFVDSSKDFKDDCGDSCKL